MKIFLTILLLGLPPAVYSQVSDRILMPPRKDLGSLYWPNLSDLEESVREQITEQQNALAVIVKNPATSVNELSEAYGKLGQIYHAYSLASSARDCYLNANVLAPNEFRWIYLLADLDRQQGRVEDGIRRYRLARTLRPDYIAAPVTLGNIFLGLNRLEEARENFVAALDIEKTNAAAHYGLGQIALSERRYAEAIQHFNTTLAQVPSANRVHYSLAMAYRGLGDVEKLKAHLAQQGSVGVRVSDPLIDGLQDLIEGERVHLARGKLAFEARRYTEAAVEFRKAVAASPGNVTARINLGATLSQLGDRTGAVEQFEEAIRIDPGRVNAHYNLAILLSGQNSHEKAISHFQSALAIEPNDLTVRYLLGRELTKAGRVDEALAEFARVVQADPNNENALIEQVKLLYRKGEFKQALDLLEKGYARYPQKVRSLAMLAYLLATSPALELRNGARALELAQRVYEATRVAQHGALVPLALAELGRCKEASVWQQRMIVLAEQQSNKALLPKLQTNLKLFAQSPCRPPADASLNDQ